MDNWFNTLFLVGKIKNNLMRWKSHQVIGAVISDFWIFLYTFKPSDRSLFTLALFSVCKKRT
ncbi:MAG: hypothetical protein V7K86_15035 [Nostoc sp.]|uniref:hypothetical protein n=1 Tax=Nostoc sp. TaxID=1180 RepID=UPI002FF442B0